MLEGAVPCFGFSTMPFMAVIRPSVRSGSTMPYLWVSLAGTSSTPITLPPTSS